MVEHPHTAGAAVPDLTPEGLSRFFEAVAALQAPDPDPDHSFDFLGPRPTRNTDFDLTLPYANFMITGPPKAAVMALIILCEHAPDDDALCFLGVQLVEPLLDLHWKEVGQTFAAEAKRRPVLRKALACALLNLRGKRGREFEARLRSLVDADQ